jgi:hypothetical protein
MSNCDECDFPLDENGDCTNMDCPTNLTEIDLQDTVEQEQEQCRYCGEPLEDGMCSASCNASAADEGREEEDEDD